MAALQQRGTDPQQTRYIVIGGVYLSLNALYRGLELMFGGWGETMGRARQGNAHVLGVLTVEVVGEAFVVEV